MLEGPLAALDRPQSTPQPASAAYTPSAIASAARCSLRHSAIWRRPGDDRIASATYFVTLVDFTDVGDISVHRRRSDCLARKAHAGARLSGSPRHGDILQYVARQRPRLVLRREQLSARKGAGALRPPVLEFGVDPHACGHAPPSICATCTSGTCWRSRTEFLSQARRSICRGSRRRHSCSQRAKITLRHGNRHMRRRDSIPARQIRPFGLRSRMAGVISAPGSKYGHWTNDGLPVTPDAWLDGARSLIRVLGGRCGTNG